MGARRPEQPEPFLRGCAFPPVEDIPYPRADPGPLGERLPRDTWRTACIPVGVRFELVGDAPSLEVEYETTTDELGYRGPGAGRHFCVWRGERCIAEREATLGRGTVLLPLGDGADASRAVLYLPEGMRPTVRALRGVGGSIEPAAWQPRWLCYGDSIAEGWVASGPARAWPAVTGRAQGLDVINLGYAGAARGEIATAEQIAALAADVISIAYGTNCWTRTPASAALFRAGLEAFLDVLREGHPTTPILALSPILRPDAESAPNRFGATLSELRAIFEEVVGARVARGDAALELVPGAKLVAREQLPDGIHPDDAGHRAIAARLGPPLSAYTAARQGAPDSPGAPR